MAFPTTGILDTFDGADETPIVTNWTTPMYSGESSGPDRWANLADFTPGSAYYDIAEYGPDVEAYATIDTKPGVGTVGLRVRIQGEGGVLTSAASYYELRWAADNSWSLRKRVSGTEEELKNGTRSYTSGDKFGLEVISTTISFYHFASSSWSLVDSTTDSDVSLAGYIGIWSDDGGCNLNDFGGGTISSGRTYKRLYGPAQLSDSAATLYTCPASAVTRTLHIHASNPSGSAIDANLSIGTDAAGTRVWDDLAIPADSVKDVFDPYELAAGETIQGWAATAGTVVVTITGYEDPV